MGAGFFLLETSNVVSLSLLYGSTWIVNVTVFAGILLLILPRTSPAHAGPTSTCASCSPPCSRRWRWRTSYPVSTLLPVRPLSPGRPRRRRLPGPRVFRRAHFARLIDGESDLAPIYGSNLLGAVIGGSCEYLSILLGLKALLIVTFGFYLLALATLVGRTPRGRGRSRLSAPYRTPAGPGPAALPRRCSTHGSGAAPQHVVRTVPAGVQRCGSR